MKLKLDKKSIIRLMILIAIIVVGVVLDQVTKSIFENLYQRDKLPIVIIPNIINFSYALNTGAAWGSFSGNNVMFFVLTLIALPVFFGVMLFRLKDSMIGSIGFACIVSGALGNAIDRAFLGDGFYNGAVRDFLETRFLGSIDFVCNVADIFLTFGVIFVIIAILFMDSDAIFTKKNKHLNEQKNNESTLVCGGGESDNNAQEPKNDVLLVDDDVTLVQTEQVEENRGVEYDGKE